MGGPEWAHRVGAAIESIIPRRLYLGLETVTCVSFLDFIIACVRQWQLDSSWKKYPLLAGPCPYLIHMNFMDDEHNVLPITFGSRFILLT